MKSLDEKVDEIFATTGGMRDDIDELRGDFAKLREEVIAFKTKTETIISLLKWIGGFTADVIVLLILNGFSVSYSAGKIDAAVGQLREDMRDLRSAIKAQATRDRSDQAHLSNQDTAK